MIWIYQEVWGMKTSTKDYFKGTKMKKTILIAIMLTAGLYATPTAERIKYCGSHMEAFKSAVGAYAEGVPLSVSVDRALNADGSIDPIAYGIISIANEDKGLIDKGKTKEQFYTMKWNLIYKKCLQKSWVFKDKKKIK